MKWLELCPSPLIGQLTFTNCWPYKSGWHEIWYDILITVYVMASSQLLTYTLYMAIGTVWGTDDA